MDFIRRKPVVPENLEELPKQLAACNKRLDAMQHMARAMLIFMKESTFDLQEINAEGQKKRLDDLLAILTTAEPAALLRSFDEQMKLSFDFLRKEKDYFISREKELKSIIDMLRGSLSEMIGSNQDFNTQVYERNIRMEQATQLDDLRRVREALKTEVDQVKGLVLQKQLSDEQSRAFLQKEVDVLKTDLERAVDASMTDGLTGAFNRLAFDTFLAKLIERYAVFTTPFSLLMCDLDNFKSINDTYGHPVGDRVLKCFVQECRTLFRSSDYVARYGGEEFAIILPGANLRQAMKRAKTLCKTLSGKRYLVDPTQPDQKLGFTVSIGVSEMRRRDMSADEVIGNADRSLYCAKHTGKNRAVSEIEAS